MNKNDLEEDPKIVKLLKSYNENQEIEAFNSQVFECIICFAEKLGKNCLQFAECQHVFCNECMRSHFDVKISQGELKKNILIDFDQDLDGPQKLVFLVCAFLGNLLSL